MAQKGGSITCRAFLWTITNLLITTRFLPSRSCWWLSHSHSSMLASFASNFHFLMKWSEWWKENKRKNKNSRRMKCISIIVNHFRILCDKYGSKVLLLAGHRFHILQIGCMPKFILLDSQFFFFFTKLFTIHEVTNCKWQITKLRFYCAFRISHTINTQNWHI